MDENFVIFKCNFKNAKNSPNIFSECFCLIISHLKIVQLIRLHYIQAVEKSGLYNGSIV